MLILIPLALLLSDARSLTAESPSHQNQGDQTQAASQQRDTITSPSSASPYQATAVPTASSGAIYVYNQYRQASPWGAFPTWLEAIATIGLVAFACWQISFVRRSTTATENAAQAANENARAAKDAAIATERYVEITAQMVKAAEKSAEAARAALHANRPYVLITGVEPASWKDQILGKQHPISRVDIIFRNVGGSPAEIIEVFATSWKFECFHNPSEPTWGSLLSDSPREIGIPVLGTDESGKTTVSVLVHWTKDDIGLVESGIKRVGIYGLIRYRGGAPTEPYYTRFFWWFSPLTSPNLQKASDPELNKRT